MMVMGDARRFRLAGRERQRLPHPARRLARDPLRGQGAAQGPRSVVFPLSEGHDLSASPRFSCCSLAMEAEAIAVLASGYLRMPLSGRPLPKMTRTGPWRWWRCRSSPPMTGDSSGLSDCASRARWPAKRRRRSMSRCPIVPTRAVRTSCVAAWTHIVAMSPASRFFTGPGAGMAAPCRAFASPMSAAASGWRMTPIASRHRRDRNAASRSGISATAAAKLRARGKPPCRTAPATIPDAPRWSKAG